MKHRENGLHQEQGECARCRNHITPSPHPRLKHALLRTALKSRTLGRRIAGRNGVSCAIGIIGAVSNVIVIVGITRTPAVMSSAHSSDGGEERGQDEKKPEKEVATDVCAWVYGA